MEVHIDEMVSTVRAVDSASLASGQLRQQILREVLAAVVDEEAHRRRVAAERRLDSHRDAEDEA